jgi:ribonuclease HI
MQNKLVVFSDGACEPKNPGGVPTYAFIIYQDEKKLAEDFGLAAEPFSPEASNNVAEYVALTKALEKVRSLGLQDSEIEVRSDSELLVNQIQGTYDVKAPRLMPYHKKLKDLLTQFKNIRFRWIRREENSEADYLSKAAYESYMANR